MISEKSRAGAVPVRQADPDIAFQSLENPKGDDFWLIAAQYFHCALVSLHIPIAQAHPSKISQNQNITNEPQGLAALERQ